MVPISDPNLDGELRLVKRSSETIIDAVYINGDLVIKRGKVSDKLGKKAYGSLLFSQTSSGSTEPIIMIR